MKAIKHLILYSILLLACNSVFSQARIQIVHNSADAAAEIVDVWLDQTLIKDNLKFRTATAFMDAPAGTQVTLAIAGPDSQNPNDPLWSEIYTFNAGEAYVLVAEGIISASGYNPPTPFDVFVFPGAREAASQSGQTDIITNHGATDAPAIDIFETALGAGQIVDNLAYSGFDGYDQLDTKDYIFEVRDQGNGNVIASYKGYLQEFGLKNKAVTMVASGFLHPENNSNGPAFGLWVAPADGGDMIELPVYDPRASVQVIHNSADEAAAVVDIWMDQTLLLDDFAFRTASQFLQLPAGHEITLAVKDAGSQNPENPLWSETFNLTVDQTYILVAEGIISGSGYNPPTPFDMAVYPTARITSNQLLKTDMLVHHGATDAPVVDIYEVAQAGGLLVDNLGYSAYSNYLEMDPLDYILELRDEAGVEKIAAYRAQFGTLGLDGHAVTVVASGFLNPGNNSNGPAFGLWMATAAGGNLIELPVYDPKARVQVIHNSADAAAAQVDIWLDDELILDNFGFRTASPFMDVPAGQQFTIAVKGPDSQNPDNPLWSADYTMTEDEAYILVANGIISESGYDPDTAFDMAVYANAREVANSSGQTDVLFHHGSTDAPAIDIIEVGIGLGQMVDNLAYEEYAGYFGLATVNYIFQIRDESGLNKIAAYSAPLANLGLQGDAITILASGFLEPGNNSGGPDFGLYIAKAEGGELIKLPVYAPMARLQVIHNSADTLIDVVDIWLNQELILDNFTFRTASPFIDAPANEQITISIKGPDSQDPFNPLYFHNYNLTEGDTYVLVADGIISDSGYEPAKPFDLAVYSPAREEAAVNGRTDILVHHGSTDAPLVDVIEIGLGAGQIVNDLEYAHFSSYLELPTIDYILEVRDATTSDLLGTYRAPLETLGLLDKAVTLVASGFVDPAVNSNGAPFGLWIAVPEGGPMIELPIYVPSARVQFIHNSGDALVSVVDVWQDETRLIDNFSFRSATAFLYLPSATAITLSVTASDAQTPASPLWSQSYTLTTDERYIMIVNGILSSSGYDPSQPFSLVQYAGAVEDAPVPTGTNVLVFHGTTDAPASDLVITGGTTVADNLAYGGFDGYTELTTSNYSMDLTNEDGTNLMGNFLVPLADLGQGGQALTILASGFISPGNNSNGPVMGLLAVETDGTATFLSNTVGIDESIPGLSSLNIYPNPATDLITISFNLKEKSNVSIEILDIAGKAVKSSELGLKDKGSYNEKIDVDDLTSGMYLLNIKTGGDQVSGKLLVR